MSTDFAPEMHERSTHFGTRFKEFIASIGFKWTQDQVGTDCGLSRRTVQGYLKKTVWPAPAECLELEAKLTEGARKVLKNGHLETLGAASGIVDHAPSSLVWL